MLLYGTAYITTVDPPQPKYSSVRYYAMLAKNIKKMLGLSVSMFPFQKIWAANGHCNLEWFGMES